MNHAEALVTTAVELACEAHRGQWRDCGAPYLIHPLEVARRLGRWGITKVAFPDLWAAAILHDTLEDTKLTSQQIIHHCNIGVAELVMELTFRCKQPGESHHEYRAAKAEYLDTFLGKTIQALVIKVDDRLCNIEDFLAQNPSYAVKYWDKAMTLFDAMLQRRQDVADFFGQEVAQELILDYDDVRHRIEERRLHAHR